MAPYEIEQDARPPARIKVIGVGGGGSNAVDGMMASGLENVEFHVINSDVQALSRTRCPNRLQIGGDVTGGLGCGGDPLIGEKAASVAKEQIQQILNDADMVFLTTGLGGGTGTGATPVIAQMAKEAGILTVAIVTRPFSFEGPQRMQKAKQGLEKLCEYADTLIVVSNNRLLEVVGNKSTLLEAFSVANSVLAQGVQSISDLIAVPGLINLDFADVRSIMGERGGAVMGVGVGKGENRGEEAVKKACSSPLLDKIEIDGATGVLICIAGPPDLRLSEINEATTMVYNAADPDANIIFGAVVDENLTDEMRITIIATGFAEEVKKAPESKNEKNRLTSPTSSVSLRAKLESMLSNKGEQEAANESSPAAPRASAPAEKPNSTPVPPPPRFPESTPDTTAGIDVDRPRTVAESTAPSPLPVAQKDREDSEVTIKAPSLHDLETDSDYDIDFESIPLQARREVFGEEVSKGTQSEMDDADLEAPAYLRRRRDLFE